MGKCCVMSKKNIVLNMSNSTTNNDNNNAFSRRRSKVPNRSGINTKRQSVFVYNNEDIRTVYTFQQELGSGYFGTVKLCHHKDDKNKIYAVKSIDKHRLAPSQIEVLSREIDILSRVDHPNIIRYYETYMDEQYFHIVTEYLSGGDLLAGMSRKKNYCEKDIAIVINKLLNAISHIHARGIVHRDLKPENILFENKNEDSDLKIIDFGVSREFFKKNDDLNSIVGTPYYVAPEVLTGKYDKKVDIWSIGIIMYVLMTGKPPFNGRSKGELFKNIQTQEIPLPIKRDKSSYSEEAVKFLFLITKKEPNERISAADALKHEWFEILTSDKGNQQVPKEILENLRNFSLPNLFQRNLLKLIVKELKSTQINKLKEAFTLLDKENTGYIDSNKLELAFHNLDFAITKEDIQDIMKNCNLNFGVSERVNYTSFIAAAIDKKELFTKELLWETFNHLDTNGTGYLTIDSIVKAFDRTGKKKPHETIVKMFEEIGLNEESKVDFDKFTELLTKNIDF